MGFGFVFHPPLRGRAGEGSRSAVLQKEGRGDRRRWYRDLDVDLVFAFHSPLRGSAEALRS